MRIIKGNQGLRNNEPFEVKLDLRRLFPVQLAS